ncbi:DUF2845 domain-containing protein [Undibacterium fentianense]|uniref:DUF2845 domain-containing protein n=1 Tax=Undibacterium fentianense TaxID=2828728 RepID=A0A941IDQ0_9BURK|nr:DUF2845 domain-containing protein [Undibacterium fentianense]MBR7801544.1 DUF2845 domain-containing protein [Undibacterium fentianense]
MRARLLLIGCGFFSVMMAYATDSYALAFRCNNYVVDVGMHKVEVMQKCGVPAAREQRTERRRIGLRQASPTLPYSVNQYSGDTRTGLEFEREIDIQLEEWVYNFGPQRFMQLLTFEDGRLKKIQELSYGQ